MFSCSHVATSPPCKVAKPANALSLPYPQCCPRVECPGQSAEDDDEEDVVDYDVTIPQVNTKVPTAAQEKPQKAPQRPQSQNGFRTQLKKEKKRPQQFEDEEAIRPQRRRKPVYYYPRRRYFQGYYQSRRRYYQQQQQRRQQQQQQYEEPVRRYTYRLL